MFLTKSVAGQFANWNYKSVAGHSIISVLLANLQLYKSLEKKKSVAGQVDKVCKRAAGLKN